MKRLILLITLSILFSCTNGTGEGPGNRRDEQAQPTEKADSVKIDSAKVVADEED